jgi:hypothetical protein
MNNSKIFQFSKSVAPIKWTGEYDGVKIKEKIVYSDGSELEMLLTLSNNDIDSMENKLNDLFHLYEEDYEDIDKEDIDDENDSVYVIVEENGNSFPIHKDVLDIYMEMMET